MQLICVLVGTATEIGELVLFFFSFLAIFLGGLAFDPEGRCGTQSE